MSEPDDQPARRERSLFGFYIAIGVAAAFFALGVWLYRPLRLSYAIYRAENAPPPNLPPGCLELHFADKWLLEVLDAARGGNRRAIEAIVDRAEYRAPKRFNGCSIAWTPVARLVAEARPKEFYEVLARRDQREALKVMEYTGPQFATEPPEASSP